MSSHLSDTHVYMDLQIVNNNQNNNEPPPVLRFEETRNSPFLAGDSADYFVSILRFSVQTGNELPVFIPSIETGENQMDINRTVYSITVQLANGESRTVPLIWIPWDLDAPRPSAPVLKQDITTRYYYMTNYTHFVAMMNNALGNVWMSFPNTSINTIPFIDFDPDTCKFNMNLERTQPGRRRIFFNTRLYELLSSFPARFHGDQGDLNYELMFMNTRETNVRPIFNGVAANQQPTVQNYFIQLFQEIATVSLWSPVSSIVFTTSLLPIKSTNTSPPRVFNDSSVGSTSLISSGSPNLANIITDFVVPISATNQYRPDMLFKVESEYRLVDMYSMPNLNRIDISVWWQSVYGDLIPLHLQPGCNASLKILFRHRRFSESNENA